MSEIKDNDQGVIPQGNRRREDDQFTNHAVSWETIESICGWNPTKVST